MYGGYMWQKHKRIGFLGLGASNRALLMLDRFSDCEITLRSRQMPDLSGLPRGLKIRRISVGDSWLDKIDEDMLIASPSVRRDRQELTNAVARGCVICSDAEIFFAENGLPTYGVTGSDGKSTTASLIGLILNKSGVSCPVIGNIGQPMTPMLGRGDCFTVELSSFMLEYFAPRLDVGCITNITPNHLDWHASFEEYRAAKLRILKNAGRTVLPSSIGDADAVIGYGEELAQLKKRRRAQVYYTSDREAIYRNGEQLLSLSDVARREEYNVKNLMMAMAVTDGLADIEAVRQVARNFHGLEHRCELFLSRDGVDYYNSSIDSTPERTAATLRSLCREAVIILGGRSKGLDYRILREVLKKYAAKVVITGENKNEIYGAIGMPDALLIDDFMEAVRVANETARCVGTLILSPASTSYDRFKNFEERGRFFKEIIVNCK